MELPKGLTTVTPLSKYLAMFLFIILPFLGFYLGMKYQQQITVSISSVPEFKRPVISTPTIAPQFIACGYPDFKCLNGFTCNYCTGVIVKGQPTPKPNTGCVCIPNSLTPTSIPNQTECNTDNDCLNGARCMIVGPMIANQPRHKVCVQKGQVIPL